MATTTYLIFESVQATAMEQVALPPVPADGSLHTATASDVEMLLRPLDRLDAYSGASALRKAAERHGSGTYAAVSERSWHEMEFEAQQKLVVTAKKTP